MNAPEGRLGLVTQDTLDGLTDLPHFRGAQKPTCPHSRRQLLANAAIAALARRLIAVRSALTSGGRKPSLTPALRWQPTG
jgi:hypothetical protein